MSNGDPLTPEERERLRQLAASKGILPVAQGMGVNRIALLQLIAGLDSRSGTLLQARSFLQGSAGATDAGPNGSTIKRGE